MLKYTVDSLDGVDESQHSLYTKSDNGFTLAVDGLEDTKGLKSALDKERLSNKDYKTTIKELEIARDGAINKDLESQGKYKELFESKNAQHLESEKNFNELTLEVAQGKGNALVNKIALSLTTDAQEIEIISKFAKEYLTFEGKEATFNKPIEELKTELSRFVLSKASGSNDGGNNKTGGNAQTKTRSQFNDLDVNAQAKFMRDGGSLTE